jgi:hypothetical protein
VPDYPRARLVPLQDGAARILDTKAIETDPDALARELMVEFHEICLRYGLDGVLDQLGLADDPSALERPELRTALAAKLGTKAEFDPRGPRNAKPRQLADCLIATLGLTLTDTVAQPITLELRADVVAAMTAVIEPGLAVPKLRDDIIAHARARCEPRHLGAFDKLVAQLDERGMKVVRQPKIPLEAVQAIQPLLAGARHAVIGGAAAIAIDRAKQVIARASAEAAARLDQPITLRLTPRAVAIERAVDPRVSKLPATVVHVLIEALAELCSLQWRTVERPVRDYAASQTFAVGDLLQHPKFGRGSVSAVSTQKIDVEFPEGKVTLVHARK